MARHVVKRDGATSTQSKPTVAIPEKAPVPGGASGNPNFVGYGVDGGLVADTNPASTVIHGISDVAPAREVEEGPAAKRFRVVDGPKGRREENGTVYYTVVYDGGITRLTHGKIYSENAVDLDLLRRQGVKFEEVDAATEAVA